MELDEELLNKIQIVSALDSHSLINGEFEYDDSSNTLYCGYYSETWKGVTTASVKLRIAPFYTFNMNIDAQYIGNTYASLEISKFYVLNYNADIPNSGALNLNSLSFTQMVIKEFNVYTEYVGNCSVSLTFSEGE